MWPFAVCDRQTKVSEECFAPTSKVEDADSTLTNRSVYKTTRRHIRENRKNVRFYISNTV